MTYLVLARKWRPRSFDTLVGQDHVVRALTHALTTQRLHHAWLFTGTRGVGKTTLLKLILGEIEPDSGHIEHGTKQSVAYFDQMREQLDEDATLADTISPGSDFVEIGNERKHVISYLEDFLFPPQRSRSPVKSLSGGERNRLLLARLFARPANILVLDEPTNDLDIDTLELLENLLQDFNGTLFLVSHDRAFLENTVTQVIAFEGNGQLTEFGGGYDDWQRFTQKRLDDKRAAEIALSAKVSQTAAPANIGYSKPASSKLSFKEQKELESLPMDIEQLETEQANIVDDLAKPETYSNTELVKNLQTRLSKIEADIEAKLSRWEVLENKEKIKSTNRQDTIVPTQTNSNEEYFDRKTANTPSTIQTSDLPGKEQANLALAFGIIAIT